MTFLVFRQTSACVGKMRRVDATHTQHATPKMARPTPNLRFAFVEGEPKPPDFDWGSLEDAYGFPIPEKVRSDIEAATRRYLLFAQCEQKAVPLSDIKNLINTLRRDAKACQTAVSKANNLYSGAAAALVESAMEKILGGRFRLQLLEFELGTFVRACDLAETVLDKNRPLSHRPGEAWGAWVREMTDIMKEHKLNIEAGRHIDGQPDGDALAPFAALLDAIQKNCLPDGDYRRHNGGAALVQAIHRARRKEI